MIAFILVGSMHACSNSSMQNSSNKEDSIANADSLNHENIINPPTNSNNVIQDTLGMKGSQKDPK